MQRIQPNTLPNLQTKNLSVQSSVEEARIKKIGVLSLANTLGIINAFFGLIFGLVLTIIDLISPLQFMDLGFPVYTSIILLPIGLGIIGFLCGLIVALFYNLSAKMIKGIKLYS